MIKDLADDFKGFIDHPQLINIFIEASIIALITVLCSYLFHRMLRGYESRNILINSWNNIIITSLRQPVEMLIWVIGLAYCIEVANIVLRLEIFKNLPTLRTIVTILSIFWYLLNLVNRLESKWIVAIQEQNSKLDSTSIGAIVKLLRIVLFTIFGLITFETLGFSISGILAFGSISGAGVSFAAKDMLANFFGALTIYLDKPFKEGDYIKISSINIEGTVEKIGLRCTIIRNLDKSPLYLPNSVFSTTAIENPSRMSHKRIKETIILRHEDFHAIDAITKDILNYLKKNAKIDQSLEILVYLTEVNYCGLCIEVSAFATSVDANIASKVKNDLMLKIASIIESHNAKFAYKDSSATKATSENETGFKTKPNLKVKSNKA